MAMFQKDQPGGAPAGHVWSDPGEIIEVIDDKVAADLRKLIHAGIHEIHSVPEGAKVTPAPGAAPAAKSSAKAATTASK